MVYYEIRINNGTKHNYLIFNERLNSKWKKRSKYLGVGNLSKLRIKEEIKKYKMELIEESQFLFLKPEEVKSIEDIRAGFNEYLLKAGKSGIETFKEWFFTELTYNSNAIEGNTLSLEETSDVINEGIVPKKASLREINEAKNHIDVLGFLENHKGEFNEKLLLKIHSFILKNIDGENAGRYRQVQVFIKGTTFVPPSENAVPMLVKGLIRWYKSNKRHYHPFELALIVTMKLVTIHPFVDGNGRVSRLVMNYLLKKAKYPEINFYVKERTEYLRAVKAANKEDYTGIIKFAIATLKENYVFLYKDHIVVNKK